MNWQFIPVPQSELADFKDWEGYITAEGQFYPTKPVDVGYWNESFNAHEDWAEAYLLSKNIRIDGIKNKIASNKDFLVKIEKMIAISTRNKHVFICYDEMYLNKHPRIQLDVLFALFILNDWDVREFFDEYDSKYLEGGLCKCLMWKV